MPFQHRNAGGSFRACLAEMSTGCDFVAIHQTDSQFRAGVRPARWQKTFERITLGRIPLERFFLCVEAVSVSKQLERDGRRHPDVLIRKRIPPGVPANRRDVAPSASGRSRQTEPWPPRMPSDIPLASLRRRCRSRSGASVCLGNGIPKTRTCRLMAGIRTAALPQTVRIQK